MNGVHIYDIRLDLSAITNSPEPATENSAYLAPANSTANNTPTLEIGNSHSPAIVNVPPSSATENFTNPFINCFCVLTDVLQKVHAREAEILVG